MRIFALYLLIPPRVLLCARTAAVRGNAACFVSCASNTVCVCGCLSFAWKAGGDLEKRLEQCGSTWKDDKKPSAY